MLLTDPVTGGQIKYKFISKSSSVAEASNSFLVERYERKTLR